MEALFKSCDAVVVPSRNEPFGIVVLEATWSFCVAIETLRAHGLHIWVGVLECAVTIVKFWSWSDLFASDLPWLRVSMKTKRAKQIVLLLIACTCTFLYLKSYQTPIFNQEQPLSAPPAAPPQHQHQHHHGRPHSHHDPQPLLLPLVLLSVLLPVFELSTDCLQWFCYPNRASREEEPAGNTGFLL